MVKTMVSRKDFPKKTNPMSCLMTGKFFSKKMGPFQDSPLYLGQPHLYHSEIRLPRNVLPGSNGGIGLDNAATPEKKHHSLSSQIKQGNIQYRYMLGWVWIYKSLVQSQHSSRMPFKSSTAQRYLPPDVPTSKDGTNTWEHPKHMTGRTTGKTGGRFTWI